MLRLLVLNVGSTSLKFKLLEFHEDDLEHPPDAPAQGRLEAIGRPSARYRIDVGSKTSEGETELATHEQALALVLEKLGDAGSADAKSGLGALSAICFKPVHARDAPIGPVEMDEDVLARMEEFSSIAPMHNPPVIAAVRALKRLAPSTPLIGLFEPTFHAGLEPKVYTQSVPAEWLHEYGIRKYGFHGASHAYVAERAPQFLGVAASELKIVSCHLGGSSSLTAIRKGKSVETTMSFSPQSGLPQGTRCGSIDPFIALYLIEKKGWRADRVAHALTAESGLLGLSGVSGEFREIEAAAEGGNERARGAIEVFAYQIQREIAALTVALEGLNTLVFTGGIGERGASFRARVVAGLSHLGLELDAEANAAAIEVEACIQSPGSKVRIVVLPTDEELVVAREAAYMLMGIARQRP